MRPQNEILDRGYKALVDALGIVDAIRFIQHFSPGYGDYTKERHQWLDKLTLGDIWADIQQRQDVSNQNQDVAN